MDTAEEQRCDGHGMALAEGGRMVGLTRRLVMFCVNVPYPDQIAASRGEPDGHLHEPGGGGHRRPMWRHGHGGGGASATITGRRRGGAGRVGAGLAEQPHTEVRRVREAHGR